MGEWSAQESLHPRRGKTIGRVRLERLCIVREVRRAAPGEISAGNPEKTAGEEP